MKENWVFVYEKVKINGKEYYLGCDSILITYVEDIDPYGIGADNTSIYVNNVEFEDEDVYVKDVETNKVYYFGDSIFDKDTWDDLTVWVSEYVDDGSFEWKYR